MEKEEGTNGRREGEKKERKIGEEEGEGESEGGGERKNERVSSATCLRIKIPYSGKLSREKLFANFADLWLFAKFSPQNLGARCSLARQK